MNDGSSSPFISALSFLLPTNAPKSEDTKIEDDLPTSHAFEVWLRTAPPAATLCYAKRVAWLDGRKPRNHQEHILSAERRSVCKAAYRAYEEGKAELCQRRVGDGFEYLIQKRREVRPIYIPTGCGRTDT